MNQKTILIGAAILAAVAVPLGIELIGGGKTEPKASPRLDFSTAVDTDAVEVLKSADVAVEIGMVGPTVYEKIAKDGSKVYVTKVDDRLVYLKESPCAWKPTADAECFKEDGGNPGVENTMQPGKWSGVGCVRKACTIFAGEKE